MTVLALAGLGLASPARGVTFTVSNLNNAGAGSLRQAVLDSNLVPLADNIVFQAGLSGTIALTTGQLVISDNVTITGPGASVIAISGNNASRVFMVNSGVSLTLASLTIARGSATDGGGIRSIGPLTMSNCALRDNVATGNNIGGGAVHCTGSFNISNCSVIGNSATDPNVNVGGGIFVSGGGGTGSITGCTFMGNSALFGGGLCSQNRTTTIANCTFTGNTAHLTGGGALGLNSGTLTISNCTLAGNTAPTGAGASNLGEVPTLNYRSSIFANVGSNIDGSGTLTSLGNNISTDGSGNLNQPGDRPNTDPLLGPLADYGGPTQTYGLLPGSPAIDSGSNVLALNSDQRGAPRVAPAACSGSTLPDIGAFEVQRLTVTNTADFGAGSLRRARDDNEMTHSGSHVCFTVTGSIQLSTETIVFGRPIWLVGPGAAQLSVTGMNARRIFLVNYGAHVGISGLTLSDGRSDRGSALTNYGTFSLTDCHLTNCHATVDGGAVILLDGSGTMTRCTISGNRSDNNGGGIWLGQGAAATRGLTMFNCTVTGNTGLSGGGIRLSNLTANNLTLRNCTIAGNTGTNGGGISQAGGTLTLQNTIIADNMATTGPDLGRTGGALNSQGHNLLGNNSGSDYVPAAGDQVGTPATPIDPLLGPLSNNGGAAPTMALWPGSPAIDTGASSGAPSADQRQIPRGGDGDCDGMTGTDIGAFEVQSFVVTTTNSQGAGTFYQALVDNNLAGGGSICMNVSGTIVPPFGQLNLLRDVSIVGPGANLLTVSGNNVARVLYVAPAVHAWISRVRIAEGRAEFGAGIVSEGVLSVNACEFEGNVGITDFNGGGAILNYLNALHVANSTFVNNHQFQTGGAVCNLNGTTTLTNCTTFGNSSTEFGGGVTNWATLDNTATMILVNCTLAGNTGGSFGSGAWNLANGGTATLTMRNCVLTDNGPDNVSNTPFSGTAVFTSLGHNLSSDDGNGLLTASGDRVDTDPMLSALSNYGGSVPTMALRPGSPALDAGDGANAPAFDQRGAVRPGVVGCGGTADVDIGAFEAQRYAVTTLADAGAGSLRQAVADNNTGLGGSHVCVTASGTITLLSEQVVIQKPVFIAGPGARHLTVSGNAERRVFELSPGVSAEISDLTIADGFAQNGGGIFNLTGMLSLRRCALENNHATNVGGGIAALGGTTAMVECALVGNTAVNNSGGGAFLQNGNASLLNCTFSGNAAAFGAAVTNLCAGGAASDMTITNCTFTENAHAGGGAIRTRDQGGTSARTTIRSVLAANTQLNFVVLGTNAFLTDQGHNLDSDGSSGLTNGANGNIVGAPGAPIAALLAPLADNGGPTFTHALLPGSPAIDAGLNDGAPVTDQRGASRPRDGNCDGAATVDIGAVERESQDTSLSLDGVNDIADAGYAPDTDLTGSLTLEAWVRPAIITGVAFVASNGQTGGYGFGRLGGRLRFVAFGIGTFDTGVALQPGVWTHIAVVYLPGNSVQFFRNGINLTSFVAPFPLQNSSASLYLGQRPDGLDRWSGDIDEVRIWNVARTHLEIQNNYDKALVGTEPGLVRYWQFNEGDGMQATDTARAAVAVLSGGVRWGTARACLPEPLGDMNCDGGITAADVPAFVAALLQADPFPGCNPTRGDMNRDGQVDGDDAGGFIEVLP